MRSAFWTKKSWSSDAARNALYRAAIPFLTKAIELDRGFVPAYAARAEAYLESKQDALAIKDYTKVLSLQPDNSTAHSDRGLANLGVGQYYAAISDFGDSIRIKQDGDAYVPTLYENRADAYVKTQDYRRAIEDYSTAIELHLKSQLILLNLQQFRGIYPEYAAVPDDLLLDNLHRRFAQQWAGDDFRKKLTKENGKWGVSFLFSGLYEKRGDAYLSIGDYRHGILDFQRIFVGMPDYGKSTERWRFLGTYGNGEKYYIDVKSSEPLSKQFPRIWVKSVGAKTSDVMAFELDCAPRKYKVTSNVVYDKDGNVVGNGNVSGFWSDVIPDTLGEQLWNGVCQSNQ
jgi:tetratricopeptide (TPR) repeat protein